MMEKKRRRKKSNLERQPQALVLEHGRGRERERVPRQVESAVSHEHRDEGGPARPLEGRVVLEVVGVGLVRRSGRGSRISSERGGGGGAGGDGGAASGLMPLGDGGDDELLLLLGLGGLGVAVFFFLVGEKKK